jgi:hypothetical protein
MEPGCEENCERELDEVECQGRWVDLRKTPGGTTRLAAAWSVAGGPESTERAGQRSPRLHLPIVIGRSRLAGSSRYDRAWSFRPVIPPVVTPLVRIALAGRHPRPEQPGWDPTGRGRRSPSHS